VAYDVLVQLSKAAICLLQRGFVQTDLLPKNVLYDAQTKEVCLVDLDPSYLGENFYMDSPFNIVEDVVYKRTKMWRGYRHDPTLGVARLLIKAVGLEKRGGNVQSDMTLRQAVQLRAHLEPKNFTCVHKPDALLINMLETLSLAQPLERYLTLFKLSSS